MHRIVSQLHQIIREYSLRLELISEQEFAFKSIPHKWSKKEILGHLVDSAQNNARRFIVAQYEEKPLIVYKQDLWVSITNYQSYPSADLIKLWILLNEHICLVLANCSVEASGRLCATGDTESHTIEWLAEDYMRHLLHHLHQILQMEPIEYH